MPPPFSPRAPSSSPAAHSLHEAKRARGLAASRGESLVADDCRGPRHRQPPCWCRPAHRTPRRVHQTGPRREAGHARLLTPPRPPGATACWPSKWGLRAARCRGRISHTPGCLSQKATFVSGRTDPRGPPPFARPRVGAGEAEPARARLREVRCLGAAGRASRPSPSRRASLGAGLRRLLRRRCRLRPRPRDRKLLNVL